MNVEAKFCALLGAAAGIAAGGGTVAVSAHILVAAVQGRSFWADLIGRDGTQAAQIFADVQRRAVRQIEDWNREEAATHSHSTACLTEMMQTLGKGHQGLDALAKTAGQLRWPLDPDQMTDAVMQAAPLLHDAYDVDKDPMDDNQRARQHLEDVTRKTYTLLFADAAFHAKLTPAFRDWMTQTQQDQTDRLTRIEAQMSARGANQAQIDALKTQMGDDAEQIANIFALLLDRHVPSSQWKAQVTAVIQRIEALKQSAANLPNDISETLRDLKLQAEAALAVKDLKRAEEIFTDIYEECTKVQAEAAAAADKALAAAEETAEQTANALSDLALSIMAQLDYPRAAATYARAAALPRLSRQSQWRYQERRASALDDQGREFGDNAALVEAITLYQTTVLPLCPRTESPEDWAGTQNNLGNALAVLGEREGSTERLEDAVTAYRNALEERTQDRVPLDWAITQANMAMAFAA